MNSKLIMIPYAYLYGFNSGVNIGHTKNNDLDIYLKNICVACISAKHYNQESDTDVALVTNIKIPNVYAEILKRHDVKTFIYEFDQFNFGMKYKWSLAFYKLCALWHVVQNQKYDCIAYLDTDVYIQDNFSYIWKECDFNILLYDISHGLQVNNYKIFLTEVSNFDSNMKYITHYGGEFFAANKELAKAFVKKCKEVYDEMILREIVTTRGDEFITSIAAYKMRNAIKNSSAYIQRFWTGTFRLVSSQFRFNPVCVLHVPAEKEDGMITLFNLMTRQDKILSKPRVYRILHLTHKSAMTYLKTYIKIILNKGL